MVLFARSVQATADAKKDDAEKDAEGSTDEKEKKEDEADADNDDAEETEADIVAKEKVLQVSFPLPSCVPPRSSALRKRVFVRCFREVQRENENISHQFLSLSSGGRFSCPLIGSCQGQALGLRGGEEDQVLGRPSRGNSDEEIGNQTPPLRGTRDHHGQGEGGAGIPTPAAHASEC